MSEPRTVIVPDLGDVEMRSGHSPDTTPRLPDPLPDFGQQLIGYEDPHPWVMPLIGALAFGAFMLMMILGRAPWQ